MTIDGSGDMFIRPDNLTGFEWHNPRAVRKKTSYESDEDDIDIQEEEGNASNSDECASDESDSDNDGVDEGDMVDWTDGARLLSGDD